MVEVVNQMSTKKESFGPLVEEYLAMKPKSTRAVYASGFRKFNEWYNDKGSLETFIKVIHEELQKPPLERRRIAELTANEWVEWLLEHKFSANSIHGYFCGIQNLLKYYHIPVSKKWIGNLPPRASKDENEKHEWKLEHIKTFFELATNYRDKALILCLFQSGQGIHEIKELNYGHIKTELEEGTLPLVLKLRRKKTNTKYRTCLGRDAVHYLKLYLQTRNNLMDDSPLFTKIGNEQRITKAAIEKRFRELAEAATFIDYTPREDVEHFSEKQYNPVRPHSLRAAFRSRLTNKMDSDLIEYLMGHEISDVKKAYLNMPTDELRELFAAFEKHLAIEKTSTDELSALSEEGAMTEEYKERIRRLEGVLSDVTKDKEAQNGRIQTLETLVHEAMGIMQQREDADRQTARELGHPDEEFEMPSGTDTDDGEDEE